MLKITDYGFLFQNNNKFGSSNPIGSFQLSNLNSKAVQNQLRAAGIDTNSKQYKAVINNMMKNANGAMYTNPQAIKNLMKNYDSDGDWVDPITGLAGLLVTEENNESRKQIIDIPESSRQEMFESTKREFLAENGVHNGDTTKRSEVYTNLYRKMEKQDRLKAGYTMEQYERAYSAALYAAVRKADPTWQIGQPIPKGAVDSVTRESVEKELVQSGNKFVTKASGETTYSSNTNTDKTRKTAFDVEKAFEQSRNNYSNSIKPAEEKPVELSDTVMAEKMKRLEEKLKQGSVQQEGNLDIKA